MKFSICQVLDEVIMIFLLNFTWKVSVWDNSINLDIFIFDFLKYFWFVYFEQNPLSYALFQIYQPHIAEF